MGTGMNTYFVAGSEDGVEVMIMGGLGDPPQPPTFTGPWVATSSTSIWFRGHWPLSVTVDGKVINCRRSPLFVREGQTVTIEAAPLATVEDIDGERRRVQVKKTLPLHAFVDGPADGIADRLREAADIGDLWGGASVSVGIDDEVEVSWERDETEIEVRRRLTIERGAEAAIVSHERSELARLKAKYGG